MKDGVLVVVVHLAIHWRSPGATRPTASSWNLPQKKTLEMAYLRVYLVVISS